MTWTENQLDLIGASDELEIAVRRADGSLRAWTPIWVVTAGAAAYVRTWHRRDTGWYGAALRSGRARLRVPGLEADVTITDVGPAEQPAVDAAYRTKYARYGSSVGPMIAPDAVASTLRLDPVP